MQPAVNREEKSNLEYIKEDNGARSAVCILHGYGANMFDLYSLKDVIKNSKNFDWYFLNAPIPLNMGGMLGSAWFPIDMAALEKAMLEGTFRHFAEFYPKELETSVDFVKVFIESELSKYDNIHLGGFSQGAMVSSHVIGESADNIKTLSLLSGNLIGRDQLEESLKKRSKFQFFQSHGTGDPVLGFDQAKDLFELLKLSGHQGEFVSFGGGHEIPMEVVAKWSVFLNKYL